MLSEWRKFAGWVVLEHFLKNPTEETYIKELSRLLGISPRSAHVYCLLYEKDGFLLSERKANARMFRLMNELAAVKALKKAYTLIRLNESTGLRRAISDNPDTLAIGLYGSYSSGEYDEKSDLDIILLSGKKVERRGFVMLEKELGIRIQLTELTPAKWLHMKEMGDNFAVSVIANNTVLHGVAL